MRFEPPRPRTHRGGHVGAPPRAHRGEFRSDEGAAEYLEQHALRTGGIHTNLTHYPNQRAVVEAYLASGATQDALFRAYLQGGASTLVAQWVDQHCQGTWAQVKTATQHTARWGGPLNHRLACAGLMVAALACARQSKPGVVSRPEAPRSDERAAKEPSTMPTLKELQNDLAPRVLAGLGGDDLERGRALLGRLLPSWLEEARAGGALAEQVLTILRGDLERDLQPLAPRERLVLLDAEVLDRELRALSNESFALGKQIVDGTAGDDEARKRGRVVLGRVEALSPKVDAITLEARRVALRRQVEDVLLEALYAVERKAMSPRLSRYAQDQRTR